MRRSTLALVSLLAVAPAPAKGTGLIFVSKWKTNNITVIDPKTYQVVKDIKVARRRPASFFGGSLGANCQVGALVLGVSGRSQL